MQDIDAFFDEIEQDIVEIQRDISKEAMDYLFSFSPHFNPFEGAFVTGKSFKIEEYFDRPTIDQHPLIDGEDTVPTYRRAMYALGEYDANHKVSSNKVAQSGFSLPTFSYIASLTTNNSEKGKVDLVDEIGDTITIENLSFHAENVETGEGWNSVKPYYPYSKTDTIISIKHADKLEKVG